MKITKQILDAINKAIEHEGTQQALAKKSGVHQKNISKYITQKVKRINDDTWEKLEPYILPWLKPESPPKPTLTLHINHEKEKALIEAFRRLTIEEQKEIELVILRKALLKEATFNGLEISEKKE